MSEQLTKLRELYQAWQDASAVFRLCDVWHVPKDADDRNDHEIRRRLALELVHRAQKTYEAEISPMTSDAIAELLAQLPEPVIDRP